MAGPRGRASPATFLEAPVNDIVVVGSIALCGHRRRRVPFGQRRSEMARRRAGLPNVPVTDLEYRAASNSLYAATFGRGIFMLTLP